MKITNYARKVDSMGRITIPAKLREHMGIEIGEIYPYSIYDYGGKSYLCIECPNNRNTVSLEEVQNAKKILREAGLL